MERTKSKRNENTMAEQTALQPPNHIQASYSISVVINSINSKVFPVLLPDSIIHVAFSTYP